LAKDPFLTGEEWEAVSSAIQWVWFKRDLRVADHEPLSRAAERGSVAGVYIYEPSVMLSPEFDRCHFDFISDSLIELRESLARIGCPLLLLVGEMPDTLEVLRRTYGIAALWSHEETGLGVTYARDKRVAAWCRAHGIAWREIPQNGVIRRLKTRDGWARRWDARMNAPPAVPPKYVSTSRELSNLDEVARRYPLVPASKLRVRGEVKPEAWRGGELRAQATLRSFLTERGANYRREMSSPTTGFHACSRLSPYLAWGAISIRTVHQACERRRQEVRAARDAGAPLDASWLGSLQSFSGRLRWHCHFMQKLEDEPRIEFENFARAYDGLREHDFDAGRFDAWCAGLTGYPMVDACMRALHAGGWLNFRMRAMLVSFASYHLWLHWRPTAQYLARHFLDFEPGIHFSQFQMQSGTTGINTVRIYSPTKQVLDQDPSGAFIKRYVPELMAVPAAHLAEPSAMPLQLQQKLGVMIGRDYPSPIVEHTAAYRLARERIGVLRRSAVARIEADAVQARHGSRRSGLPQTNSPRRKRASRRNMAQLSLLDDE
jgi:deoxyribodipyrimidine photo-lyase